VVFARFVGVLQQAGSVAESGLYTIGKWPTVRYFSFLSYGKTEKEDLSAKEIKILKALVEENMR